MELQSNFRVPKFITVKQFCCSYSISVTHFYRLVKRGEIIVIKVGRATRIGVDDAEAWAASLRSSLKKTSS